MRRNKSLCRASKGDLPMKTALIDDLPEEIVRLKNLLLKGTDHFRLAEEEIDVFKSGEKFLEHFQPGRYDLIFFDIFMDGISGVDAALKVRETDERAHIVFITTSNDYASESYAVRADYYLLKPYTDEQARELIDLIMPRVFRTVSTLTLPDGTEMPVDSIVYTEYGGHYAYIHSKNGRVHRIRMGYAELEDALCRFDSFMSCYKGVIVNFDYVENIKGDVLLLKNKDTVPMSRRKTAEIKAAFADYSFRSM